MEDSDERQGNAECVVQSLPKLVALVGTNASGKSALGVRLAERYSGEIISADSRQVFEGLNLGSGKITQPEMRGVPHHLLDVCDPGSFFSMADFQRLAFGAIEDVLHRGKVPFLVGGTGLYVDAVIEGYELRGTAPDLRYRAQLETYTTQQLYAMLTEKLPETDVDPHNRNRVMRLLERLQEGSYHPPQKNPRYHAIKLGISWERSELQQRIEQRLERRLQDGMVAEVKGLLDAGVDKEFLLKLGLEYRFITKYLLGDIQSETEMKHLLFIAIRQFAKRQMTWFRKDPHIHWLNMREDPFGQACALVDAFLE